MDELRNRRVEYLEFGREITCLLEEEDRDARYSSILNLLNLHPKKILCLLPLKQKLAALDSPDSTTEH